MLLLFVLLNAMMFTSFIVSAWPSDGAGFPNPAINFSACMNNENISSNVCDPDGIIGPIDDGKIMFIINEISNITDKCGEKYQIAAAIVDILEFRNGIENDNDAIKQFADNTYDNWGLGGPKCDSGVIFVLAINNEVFHFSTGTGTENIITQNNINNMFSMIASFNNKEWGNGTIQAMKNIKNLIIENSSDPNTSSNSGLSSGAIFGIVLTSLIGAITLGIIICWMCDYCEPTSGNHYVGGSGHHQTGGGGGHHHTIHHGNSGHHHGGGGGGFGGHHH